MNIFHHTVNKREVKHYASFVLLATLKLVAITEKTPLKTLIDMLIGAAIRCSSIEQTCKQHEKTPSGKTVRTHIEQQLENKKDVEVRINRALRKNLPERLRRKPLKVAIDCLEISYHGTTDDPEDLRKTRPKEGTSYFHTYASAYVIEKGMRYTLAMTYVTASDTMLDVVRRLNKRLNQLGIHVELYVLDRGYYCIEVIRWFIQHNKAFIMPVKVNGRKSKGDKPASGMRRIKQSKVSRWDTYTLHSRKVGNVTFDVAICCDDYKGKKGRHGRRTLVYATYGVKHHSLPWVRDTYRTRFGIETAHRQVREAKIKTSTRNSAVRYFYLGISFVLRNIWVWLHWQIFSQNRRGPGGRKIRLTLFSLDLLKSWIRSVLAEIYVLREQIPINQPLPPEMLLSG